MVLHRNNFEIPARFSFRPFSAQWQVCTAELLGWSEMPNTRLGAIAMSLSMAKPVKEVLPEHEQVSVRVEVPDGSTAGLLGLYGLGLNPTYTVEMLRGDVPNSVLARHENRQISPDISGRNFFVLVCSNPAFKERFQFFLKPSDITKNAWAMRNEFMNLEVIEDEFDWAWSLRQFLNRWGLWNYGLGFHSGLGLEMPGFALAFPHLLREKREEYRKALEPKSARKWLSTANPLSSSFLSTGFTTIDKPPYFLVERSYCEDAIRATITIDHLAGRLFGFCKRCGKQFEQETEHKKNYCSRPCIQAANVKKWRDKQKKTPKGAKRNAKG